MKDAIARMLKEGADLRLQMIDSMTADIAEAATPGFIRERLGPLLPKYMLPTVFNWMQLMPRNPNGKIDRAKLVASVN